ncbi:MAG: type II toxin-antitoxin system RelE/ParE family toxin [Candidatus Pacearchaeota archaeon]|nr:type II toxin-antitoxin system RelE/ParE family toxin [Candidatus Pacearchaeota archaeon]MDE1848741.1 type II toxin-antitoxin system RelE/ParE family toxin [Nanoarchaeota archaeon]
MYSILFNPKAEYQLRKLGKSIQERVLNALERIKFRPFSFDVKRLQGTFYYRLRVGEYRVIIDIKQDKMVIIVIEIGHRKNIYKS